MNSNVLPRRYNHLELWWIGLPSSLRWFIGCVSTAALVGFTGGILA